MLVWSFPVRKRHAGLDDTSDRGVSWVNTWRSGSPWGCLWCLSAGAVSLLVITWPFSHVEMSVTWTKLPFPPIWNKYAFASSGRKPLVLVTESRVTLHSPLHMPDHSAMGIGMVVLGSGWSDYWKGCRCCWHIT